eukprot:scaffold264048_cov34-Prasinocladus_malaysianus.AAC.1
MTTAQRDVEAAPSNAAAGGTHDAGAEPNEAWRRSLKVFHRTSGLILSWGFVFLPYIVSQLGVTLSVALFISALFASYYGAYNLVCNHAVNGGNNKCYREVVSPATGSRSKCSLVELWRWAALALAIVAIFSLAGTTLFSINKALCGQGC